MGPANESQFARCHWRDTKTYIHTCFVCNTLLFIFYCYLHTLAFFLGCGCFKICFLAKSVNFPAQPGNLHTCYYELWDLVTLQKLVIYHGLRNNGSAPSSDSHGRTFVWRICKSISLSLWATMNNLEGVWEWGCCFSLNTVYYVTRVLVAIPLFLLYMYSMLIHFTNGSVLRMIFTSSPIQPCEQ